MKKSPVHPSLISPQDTGKSQLLISKIMQTMIGLSIRAEEVGDEVDISIKRCKYLQERDGCDKCPLWTGEYCIASKWSEIFTEDMGWTPEIVAQLQAFMPDKGEKDNDSENTSE